ncbi:MAG TPA: Rid family hydrolase [Vitreimonas sp.]|uniref:Rid family hydrolase n=1 Tax=Vitreimonas sp. TaxID=3069702 RepID=UPI002D5D2E54|nr:Rid family hydrolase [Vitreimonas sp.]HYD86643.1 Rid family hydrolase [Vitreimonas sp.]
MRFVFLAAAAALAGCVAVDVTETGRPSVRESIVPAQAQRAYDELHFSPAMRAGDYVFLSGVVAGLPESQRGDPAAVDAAYERAFRIVGMVLGEAGAEWSDVVEITTYHTDLPAQFEAFSRVKDRYVPEPYPAWTAIDVDRLLPDDGMVEIRVIAYAPRDGD